MSEAPPPDPTRLLALLRDEPPSPADARARVRARLQATILAGGGGGGGGGDHSGGGAGAGAAAQGGAGAASVLSRALTGRALAIFTFVAGGIVGAALHAALTNAPAPRIIVAEPAAAHVAPPARETPSAAAVPDELPAASAAVAAPPAPRPSGSAPGPSQLAAERLALDEVRTLLVQGDASGAIDKLRVVQRRFPHPVLGEERDALTVEALVGAGRYDEARSLADAFHRRSPDSLFTTTVSSAIRSIPAQDAGAP